MRRGAAIVLLGALACACAGQTITASYERGGAHTVEGTDGELTRIHLHDDGTALATWLPRLFGVIPPQPPTGRTVTAASSSCGIEFKAGDDAPGLYEVCEVRRTLVYVPPSEHEWREYERALDAYQRDDHADAPSLGGASARWAADLSFTLPIGEARGGEYAVLRHHRRFGLLGLRVSDLAYGFQGAFYSLPDAGGESYLFISTGVAGRYTGSITRLLALELGVDLNFFPATETVYAPSLLHAGARLLLGPILLRGKIIADIFVPDELSYGIEVGLVR